MNNILSWTAFFVVVIQLWLVKIGALPASWVFCLIACILWSAFAIRTRNWALLAQQIVVALLVLVMP